MDGGRGGINYVNYELYLKEKKPIEGEEVKLSKGHDDDYDDVGGV